MYKLRILIIGDVVGAPGQAIFQKYIPKLREELKIDAVIVNGENSAEGKGITPKIMHFFKHLGVNMVTSGNHIWQKKEIISYFSEQNDLLRPVNFASSCPGSGIGLFSTQGVTVGVINVQGRVFMKELIQCPLKAVESALTFLKSRTKIVIVDMHAEATAEKVAMALYFDGQVSAVVGTHTHIQTADERVLPLGTAYITDLGMCGALNSVIGVRKEPVIYNMLTQMPARFDVDTAPPYVLSGVWVDIEIATGKALAIERVRVVDATQNV